MAPEGGSGPAGPRPARSFANADPTYLRDVQYVDSSKLAARANLHIRYGRGGWFPWLAGQVPWPHGDGPIDVLEIGCGAGWLWAEAVDALPASRVSLTLTDLSVGMVTEAAERARGLDRYASVEGRDADAADLPFGDDTFDVGVSNHMLYHLPEPAAAVGELARTVRSSGVVAVATNGRTHLTELWQVRAEVFGAVDGLLDRDVTVDVFGLETGEPMLRERFGSVELHRFPDRLRCTDPDDVVAFLTSSPPGEDAVGDQLAALEDAVARRFEAGGGTFEVTKDVGLFVCRDPR